MRTHYENLGLKQDASAAQIKRSYRFLVKCWHPDLFPSGSEARDHAEVRIREINAAYSVLSNASKRAEYDDGLTGATGDYPAAKPEHCSRCGRVTLYWSTEQNRRVCDECGVLTVR